MCVCVARANDTEILSNRGTRTWPTHVLRSIRSLNERAKQKRRDENIDIGFHSASVSATRRDRSFDRSSIENA